MDTSWCSFKKKKSFLLVISGFQNTEILTKIDWMDIISTLAFIESFDQPLLYIKP